MPADLAPPLSTYRAPRWTSPSSPRKPGCCRHGVPRSRHRVPDLPPGTRSHSDLWTWRATPRNRAGSAAPADARRRCRRDRSRAVPCSTPGSTSCPSPGPGPSQRSRGCRFQRSCPAARTVMTHSRQESEHPASPGSLDRSLETLSVHEKSHFKTVWLDLFFFFFLLYILASRINRALSLSLPLSRPSSRRRVLLVLSPRVDRSWNSFSFLLGAFRMLDAWVSSIIRRCLHVRRAPGSIGTRSNSRAVPRRSFGESAKDSLTFGFQPAAPRMQIRTSLYSSPTSYTVWHFVNCRRNSRLVAPRALLSVTTRRWKTCATMHDMRMRCSVEGSLINDFTKRGRQFYTILYNFSIKKSVFQSSNRREKCRKLSKGNGNKEKWGDVGVEGMINRYIRVRLEFNGLARLRNLESRSWLHPTIRYQLLFYARPSNL